MSLFWSITFGTHDIFANACNFDLHRQSITLTALIIHQMLETCEHTNGQHTLIATDRIPIHIKLESGPLDSKCGQRKKIFICHSLYNITPFVLVHLLATKSGSYLRRRKKSTENRSKRVASFPQSSVLERDFIS